MNADEAWDRFRTQPIQKASIQEQLDTLAAAVNEIRADTSRTAEIVPQIMGDNAAIDTANSDAGMDAGMGGAGMGSDTGAGMDAGMGMDAGADAGSDLSGGMPGAGDDITGAMGGEDMNANMDEDQMPPAGGAAPGAEEMTPPMDGGEDMAGGAPEGAPAEDDDEGYLSDEEIDAMLADLYNGNGEAEDATPAEDAVGAAPGGAAPGGADLTAATNNLLAALKQAAHEAVDRNDIDRVVELSHIEQQIMQTLGGEVGATEPVEGVPEAGAPVPEAAPDVSEAPAEEEVEIDEEVPPEGPS